MLLAVAHLLLDDLNGERVGDSSRAARNVLRHSAGLSVGELAATLGLTHSATVRVVDRLAGHGHLSRAPAGPGRRIALRLTDAGWAAARADDERRRTVLDHALADLDESDRTTLLALLSRVALSLATDRETAERACRRCDQTTCLASRCPLPA